MSSERTMLLKLYIANNLREKYLDAVVAHNNKLDNDLILIPVLICFCLKIRLLILAPRS